MRRLSQIFYLYIIGGFATTTLVAQVGPESWLDPRLGRIQPSFTYQALVHEQQNAGASAKMGPIFQSGRYILPLQQSERKEMALSFDYERFDLNTDAVGSSFSEIYEDYRFGYHYRQWLREDRQIGFSGQIGSPSDEPYHSFDDVSLNATAMLRQSAGKTDAWYFFLNFSNTREWLPYVPIPGIGYAWQSREDITALWGVPYTVIRWKPTQNATLLTTYWLPRTIFVRGGYRLTQQWELYSSFAWNSRRYFRRDRSDNDDRLQFYQKQVAAGVVWQFSERLRFDFKAGYGFDRFIFEGEDYSDRGDNRINIGDGPFFGINASMQF